MAIIAVIYGADTWNNIEEYCEAREEWLSKFLNLQNGIPITEKIIEKKADYVLAVKNNQELLFAGKEMKMRHRTSLSC